MIDLVAKKYTKAILDAFSAKEIEDIVAIFSTFSKVIEDKAICSFLYSPFVDKAKK